MRRQGVKQATKGANGKKKKKEENQSKWSADQFLEKAEELVETYNPELAQKFYERVIVIQNPSSYIIYIHL